VSGQPWAVYGARGRYCVRRWNGNTGLVAIYAGEEEAKEAARGFRKDDRERRAEEHMAWEAWRA
jgi:hypothetical protein